MNFSLKNYNPSVGQDKFPNSDNDPSGAYIFKPLRDDQEKHAYSNFSSYSVWDGANTGVKKFTLYFTDEDKKELYTAIIT